MIQHCSEVFDEFLKHCEARYVRGDLAFSTLSAYRGAQQCPAPSTRQAPPLLWRVGFCIDIFEACTMFIFITARVLRFPPYRGIS